MHQPNSLTEPKINDAVKKCLLDLQIKNDQGEHFLRMIEGLIHRLILELETEDPDPYDLMPTQDYLTSLVNLHAYISTLAYPDGDRFDPPFC